jgi:hypothetical protein
VISADVLADFRTEGQGIMTEIINVVWTIEPMTPPRPFRHCSSCGGDRPFGASGKVRMNANGRRLDAWLIYRCETCGKTWNLPLLERAAIGTVSTADLQAMQQSDPDWVRARTFDLAVLGRYCDRIDVAGDLRVTKTVDGDWSEAWSIIALTIHAPDGTGPRLDRLLANELRLSRSDLQSMWRAGGLQCGPGSDRILRLPVRGCVNLRFIATGLTEQQRAGVAGRVAVSACPR